MSRERVLFYSDGLRLVGELYLPAGRGPWPGLVICHGLASRKERHADFAAFVAAQGLATLAFDLRGHGESEGKFDGRALHDVHAALAYLAGRPEVDGSRLALRGSSLGGNLAIHAAATFAEVRACVAICPAPEQLLLEGLKKALASDLQLPDLRIDVLDAPRAWRERSLRTAVTRITPRPLLLVHALGDELIPASYSQELHDLAGEPKEIWLLPGGSHTSAQHDVAVHERTVAWLLRALTP